MLRSQQKYFKYSSEENKRTLKKHKITAIDYTKEKEKMTTLN